MGFPEPLNGLNLGRFGKVQIYLACSGAPSGSGAAIASKDGQPLWDWWGSGTARGS